MAFTHEGASRARVVIVSNNPETLDGLEAYLERTGISSRSTRALHDLAASAPADTAAAVIFPDDFSDPEVLDVLQRLRRQRPRMLALLITSDPGRLRAAIATARQSPPPILLPKPSFGWEIVDAIRAHAAADPP